MQFILIDTCWVQFENTIYVLSQPEIRPRKYTEYHFKEEKFKKPESSK